MRPISSLPVIFWSISGSWQMFLFWGSVYILISGFREKRWINPALRNTLIILLCFVNYGLFQCTIGYISGKNVTETIIHVIEVYANMPVSVVVAVCLLLTAVEVVQILYMRRWYNTHITPTSIKETVETIPVGICAFEPGGKIALRNRTMEQLCRKIFGGALLNGKEFAQQLEAITQNLTDMVHVPPDDSVWSFTKDEIQGENNHFTLLIAYNVTEAYQKTQTLAERQKIVRQLNRKLVEYGRQIEQVIAQQETLNAKIRIHDELGSDLLTIKRYLVSGGSDTERANLLEHLKENIRFLQQETAPNAQDEYALILATAETLGVAVKLTGTMPAAEPERHILTTAIHECFTNILRHTDGDTLYVNITEDANNITARFTDDNTRIVEEIMETGGLGTLRNLTEQANGEMHIATEPRYCLTITLPKEAENHDPSCSDCG